MRKGKECDFKLGFSSEKSALECAARRVKINGRRRRVVSRDGDTPVLRVYRCDMCGLWHLTKRV